MTRTQVPDNPTYTYILWTIANAEEGITYEELAEVLFDNKKKDKVNKVSNMIRRAKQRWPLIIELDSEQSTGRIGKPKRKISWNIHQNFKRMRQYWRSLNEHEANQYTPNQVFFSLEYAKSMRELEFFDMPPKHYYNSHRAKPMTGIPILTEKARLFL